VLQVWYGGDDECNWAETASTSRISWILNRGDSKPTANVICFAFVQPSLLAASTSGVPSAMISAISYFQNAGILVVLSIGGASYVGDFEDVLNSASSTQSLAENAASVASQYHVGIEIDFEPNDISPYEDNLALLVSTYRGIIPYSASGAPESVLNIDVGPSSGWPAGMSAFVSAHLSSFNWANAMVNNVHCESSSTTSGYWESQISAGITADKLVGSIWAEDRCENCSTTVAGDVTWAVSNGLRGVSYWALGSQSGGSYGEYIESECTYIESDSEAVFH